MIVYYIDSFRVRVDEQRSIMLRFHKYIDDNNIKPVYALFRHYYSKEDAMLLKLQFGDSIRLEPYDFIPDPN